MRGDRTVFGARAAIAVVAFSAPYTLVACAGAGWVEVPTYQHYYFYEPRVDPEPPSAIGVKRNGATVDLVFEDSKNVLSMTTLPSRGDQGLAGIFALVRSNEDGDYTGILALDSVGQKAIPMRLWLAASCRGEDWVMVPGKVRLINPSGSASQLPLTVYLKPTPAVLHPDLQVRSAHWQYKQLDPDREIHCAKGDIVAFTVGFDMTFTLTPLKVVFADSLQSNGEALHIPDVELSLTGEKIYRSTKRVSIVQILVESLARP